MSVDFTGEVALVTGAAGGMGRAIAVAFARAGANVVMGDIDADGGHETERLVSELGVGAVFIPTDVSDADQVRALLATAVDRFGAVHNAVNAAAIENETAPLHQCDDDQFDRMQDINVRGLFLCTKHEIVAMLNNDNGDDGRGRIVNIASTN
ncbi:MAG: SDR family NAD(P)-dependent oxidoreductase, partial [Ilumatobacteraceae bacterium]